MFEQRTSLNYLYMLGAALEASHPKATQSNVRNIMDFAEHEEGPLNPEKRPEEIPQTENMEDTKTAENVDTELKSQIEAHKHKETP